MNDPDSEFPAFSVTLSREGDGRIVVSPRGELDLGCVPDLEHQLVAALGEAPTVLDLSGLTFLDSTGISLLVGISRTARSNGWELEVRNPSPPVEKLVALTKIGPLLGSPGPSRDIASS